MMNTKELEKILIDIDKLKENNFLGVEEFIKLNDLTTPEKMIDFQVSLGNYANKYVKRKLSIAFLKLFSYTSDDLKKARYFNPELQIINKLRIIDRYREKNFQTKQFADNSGTPITTEEIRVFLENDGKLPNEEIAKLMKRTLSTVFYLRKHCRNVLKK